MALPENLGLGTEQSERGGATLQLSKIDLGKATPVHGPPCERYRGRAVHLLRGLPGGTILGSTLAPAKLGFDLILGLLYNTKCAFNRYIGGLSIQTVYSIYSYC